MDDLSAQLDERFSDLKNQNIAVAVSGGPDSLALWHVLRGWSGAEVQPLIVDHGLREESAVEAEGVAKRTGGVVLTWDETPESRIQERAREGRYGLMAGYMAEHGLRYLFLAHHMDDQAETFLLRLAGGSGVDGLACMSARQSRGGVILCRPFLEVRKSVLTRYCDSKGLSYVRDPSNESDNFARVRVRKSMDILAQEGLSVERLARSVERFARARDALEYMAENAYKLCVLNKSAERIVFDLERLRAQPEEIVVRIVLMAIEALADSTVRLHRVEDLCSALFDPVFRKRTLGGCVFSVEGDRFVVARE